MALGGLVALPAQADVLEVSAEGEAQWIAGPVTAVALSASYLAPVALVEVPAETTALVPEGAVADTMQHAAAVPPAYAPVIMQLAERFDLSPALLEALVWQESRWHADAVSSAGARGLAQLMPGTAREMGVDPDNPYANLEGGARYLREQLDRFDGDLERALAAYNAGPGRVISSGGVPNIRETRLYVAAIMGRLANHSRSTD
ncbi:MAG: lytic transglycosylase domain-containing protein [Erythrobacter sp.]|nr:lytic transglycosylase domain-containing protein [Erythrobacter sp.]